MPACESPRARWNMDTFSAWNPASVTNWNLYPILPSSCWKLAMVTSSSFFFQLKDGEQLYARSLPGKFADAIHAKFPGKLLAYNCSPSFTWKKKLDDVTIANFQPEHGKMGYKFP